MRHFAALPQGNPFARPQHSGISQNTFGAQPHGGGGAPQNGFNNQQHQQVCHETYTQQTYAVLHVCPMEPGMLSCYSVCCVYNMRCTLELDPSLGNQLLTDCLVSRLA